MSRAEIFKIIDVVSDSAPDSEADGRDGRESGDHGKNRDHLALWSSPAEETALATLPQQTPVIDLTYVDQPSLLDDRLVMLREPESARAQAFAFSVIVSWRGTIHASSRSRARAPEKARRPARSTLRLHSPKTP